LKIALERAENDEKMDIYENLFEIYGLAGKSEKSLEVVEKMIEIEPENEELENLRVEVELNVLFGDKNDKKVKIYFTLFFLNIFTSF
jgi:uncharacterized membrane protein